jgi:hypothetical protein
MKLITIEELNESFNWIYEKNKKEKLSIIYNDYFYE